MEQFVVPQFIDVEDKIIGPLTVRQFIIIMVVGFMVFLEFRLATFGFFLLECVLTIGAGVLFAFVKFNGMPFHFFLVNIVQTLRRPKVRVWQRTISASDLGAAVHPTAPLAAATPALSSKPLLQQSRLQQLTLQVDTGGAYRPEEELDSKSKA